MSQYYALCTNVSETKSGNFTCGLDCPQHKKGLNLCYSTA